MAYARNSFRDIVAVNEEIVTRLGRQGGEVFRM